MKRNISDLLDHYPADNVELGGNIPYSPARIKEITMNNIKNMEFETNRAVKRFKPARLLIAVAAAAALSVSALAAGRVFGAGELFQDFFAKENGALSQGQLDTIDRLGRAAGEAAAELPAAVTQNGAAITPLAAIADENVCYLRLRVEAPEGTALPDLNGDIQGYYQLNASLESEQGAYMQFGYYNGDQKTVLPDEEPNDNRKEFVLCFGKMEGQNERNPFDDGTSKVLTIPGLWVQSPDKEYTNIFTGNFVFDFGPSFQNQAEVLTLASAGLTWSTQEDFHGTVYDITNTVEDFILSPLSLSYRYTTTLPENPWVSSGLGPVKIVLKDGTVIGFSHGYDNETGTREFQGFVAFDQPLDLSQVDYVQYGDNKIPVNAG